MRRTALRRPETFTDKYKILGKIGEGTYGLVYKAEGLSSAVLPRPGSTSSSGNAPEDEEPMTFAVKVVKPHKEGANDVVLSSATVREIKLLRELQHDNIMHLHDVHVDPRDKTLALVFEYGDHDLHDIILQSKQKKLSEYTKKSLMYQILKGVDYMHDSWVMHRDMKPQNILVVGHGRKRGQVKLGDFGLARVYKEPIKALSDVERVVVTLWYRAPELLLGAKHYTKAVDMWAVGCIFAEIVNSRELFCGKEVEGNNAPFQNYQLDKIFKVLGMPTPQSWKGMDKLPEYPQVMQMGRERKYPTQSELKNVLNSGAGRGGAALLDLISRLLEYDPEVRITAKDALQHEYFKEIEPEPRDWAFDEPGKEPVSFRTQTVEPVTEENLPWKTRKDTSDAAIKPPDSNTSRTSPHNANRHDNRDRRENPPRNNRNQHPPSRDARGRNDRPTSGEHANRSRKPYSSNAPPTNPSNTSRDDSRKRGSSDRPSEAGRSRSPKQPRRR